MCLRPRSRRGERKGLEGKQETMSVITRGIVTPRVAEEGARAFGKGTAPSFFSSGRICEKATRGEGHPGGVVDADVDELPSDAPALALPRSVAGDAMADPVEAAELFDIDVDQFAGMLALVAAHRRRGFERLDAGE